jgi:hypothetical protein
VTGPVRHLRLAAVQRCRPLIGVSLIESWRARSARFPGRLVAALVEQALAPETLTGWPAPGKPRSRRSSRSTRSTCRTRG